MNQKKMTIIKKLKLFIKNHAFRLSESFAIKRIKKIMKNSKQETHEKHGGKKILFNILYGMYGKIIFSESGIAKALQMGGHDVKALMCGRAFTMCTTEYTTHSVHDDKTCKHCVNFSSKLLETVKIPYSTYTDIISEKEISDIEKTVKNFSIDECKKYVYKDITVGVFAQNSTIRYFKGSIKPDGKEYEEVLRQELINALIATDAAEKIVKKEKPDVLYTRHLGYSSWGSFAEYFTKNGVRVVYPGVGYKAGAIAFDNCKIDNGFKEYFKNVRKNKYLNKQEISELQTFMDNRMKGVGGDTSLYNFSDEESDLEKQFNFDNYGKTYAIFPNLPWDISLLNANQAFKGVYDWVSYTIELFKERPDQLLIIKIHPAENLKKSESTISDFIKNKFNQLPENIIIISPDTKLSAYRLFPFIDVGISYNGIIGLEMTLNNIPVVVTALTHYGENGFTFDVKTKKEYENKLFNEKLSLTKEEIDLAKVYAYFFFIKSYIPFNIVDQNNFFDINWKFDSFDALTEGKNKFLDQICNYIAYGGTYQDW